MAIPQQIDPTCLNDYLEIMTKAVFQAGVSWALVDSKWSGFRRAFEDFDPIKVSSFTDLDVSRLVQDTSILRSRKKILGTIDNARTILALEREYGGFSKFLRSKGSYEELSKDMRGRFRYLGELSIYYFLFRVKEPVPDFHEWIKTIEGNHPRMKEMVESCKIND